jgi:hypothetical protein
MPYSLWADAERASAHNTFADKTLIAIVRLTVARAVASHPDLAPIN